jgi:hypothetical protein
MKKTFGVLMMLMAMAPFAMAVTGAPRAPEIDANSAASALTLLSGALVVFRARRKR